MSRYKTTLARLATALARPLSMFVGSLRGSTAVSPLPESFYTVQVPALDGRTVGLDRFAGQVALVVNVASECGFTPQNAGLQRIHTEYAPRGFTVLGFPSNEFGAQEPGSPEDIRAFCERQYGITFPLFAKAHTKPGPDQSPAYTRLGQSGHLPPWNYFKYLVDRSGQVAAVFPTNVPPESAQVRSAIERALARTG